MKDFLDKYDTIIFDMDGVMTSEECYWDVAALTVYETLDRYFDKLSSDILYLQNNVGKIRKEIFCDDKLITLLKNKGTNSNWDIGYVAVLIAFIINSRSGEDIYEYAKGLSDNILDEYDSLANEASNVTCMPYEYMARNGKFWCNMRDVFQEWFLGSEQYKTVYGNTPSTDLKTGLIYQEKPLIPLDKLKNVLDELGKSKDLRIGTGRPYIEMYAPLSSWGIIDYFSPDGLGDYNYVMKAEADLAQNLTKPHPYIFLKSLFGTDYPDERIIKGEYDASKIQRTLIVGDAGADGMAAHAMGADFCAVLTGVAGQKGREYFEEIGAEYILDSVCDLI